MDAQTLGLALILVLLNLTFIGALVAVRRKAASLKTWALGFAVSALGFILLSLLPVFPSPLLMLLGNTFVVCSVILVAAGLAYFLDVPRPWLRYGVYLTAFILSMAAFSFLWPSYPIRVSLTSSFFVLLLVEFLVMLVNHGREVPPPLRKLLGLYGFAFLVFHGIRAVVILASGARSLMSDSSFTGITFLGSIGFAVLWGGMILLLDADRLQSQVSSRNEKLLRLNKLKDRVLAMTSHDLRGPLGNLQVLWGELSSRIAVGDCSDLDPELLEMVERSLAGTQSLLENLFSFAEFHGAAAAPLVRANVSLAISVVIEQWGPLAAAKGVEIVREGEAGSEQLVRAAFGAVTTVLRNLLGNAIKFTPAGGRVTVRLLVPDAAGSVVAEVVDTGVGMTAELMEKTSHLESRVSRPGTGGERGSGFGLVLVKELVDDWGGRLEFESEPGRGTRVRLGFPR